MNVVIDASLLLLVLDDSAAAPPVLLARERVNNLLNQLSDARTTVLIPAPVWAEVLSGAGSALEEYVSILRTKSRWLQVSPFDERAAIECGIMLKDAYVRRRRNPKDFRKPKVKFDHQIVAIAKVTGSDCLYANDNDLLTLARQAGINAQGLEDLPIANEDRQLDMLTNTGENSKG